MIMVIVLGASGCPIVYWFPITMGKLEGLK